MNKKNVGGVITILGVILLLVAFWNYWSGFSWVLLGISLVMIIIGLVLMGGKDGHGYSGFTDNKGILKIEAE